MRVMTPMVVTPHLIGKQPKQVSPSVLMLEHAQRQQQHGCKMSFGLFWEYSVSGADFSVAAFSDFFEDFLDDFFEAYDFGYSSAIIIGSISGASSILIIFSLCLSKIIINQFYFLAKFKKLMEKLLTANFFSL